MSKEKSNKNKMIKDTYKKLGLRHLKRQREIQKLLRLIERESDKDYWIISSSNSKFDKYMEAENNA